MLRRFWQSIQRFFRRLLGISRITPPQRLSDNAATTEAIKTALASPYSIFHFNGHGSYNFFHPKKSYLALSGNDKLTIEEIVRIPLHPC